MVMLLTKVPKPVSLQMMLTKRSLVVVIISTGFGCNKTKVPVKFLKQKDLQGVEKKIVPLDWSPQLCHFDWSSQLKSALGSACDLFVLSYLHEDRDSRVIHLIFVWPEQPWMMETSTSIPLSSELLEMTRKLSV
ncbi:hypothetical protein MKW98_011069 [Papaver atlanticum]|uniref:Uncharacterized protein n=1 Tax=Papaver atlanticum TaxID=357466 RepID=A0AAD4TFM3_9MAGN|nr:hypothetical protein MKW98_011069 [Papaver atlanticum]